MVNAENNKENEEDNGCNGVGLHVSFLQILADDIHENYFFVCMYIEEEDNLSFFQNPFHIINI